MMLLSCGSNGNYQLGSGDNEDTSVFSPCKFNVGGIVTTTLPSMVQKVVCGGNHSMVLLLSGELYSCGDNTYGQCGIYNETLGTPAHVEVFTRVPGAWKNAACGWEFSVLLDASDQVFVCGLGLKGELGLGKLTTRTNLVNLGSASGLGIADIKTSINLVLCRGTNGVFYGWGDSKKGQLTEKQIFHEPQRIEFSVSEVIDYQITKNCVVLATKHQLHSIGKTTEELPSGIPVRSMEYFRAMWSSIHYKQAQTIVSIGNSKHGQKFNGDLNTQDFKFEVGSEHGLVYIRDELYAWGWGEHGNCGVSKQPGHDQIIFSELNHIYTGHIQLIAGGCATSWVVV